MEPILPLDSAEVFFDGIFSEPRLRHPEGIAIDADGDIWCGGETAEIYRMCHPTNCAFRGEELFTSNLGRWHITRIEARSEGLVLP